MSKVICPVCKGVEVCWCCNAELREGAFRIAAERDQAQATAETLGLFLAVIREALQLPEGEPAPDGYLAGHVEELVRQRDALRAALAPFVALWDFYGLAGAGAVGAMPMLITVAAVRDAREALGTPPNSKEQSSEKRQETPAFSEE